LTIFAKLTINQLNILLMKTKHFLVLMITSFFLLYGCSNNEDSIEESAFASKSKNDGSKGSSVIHQEYLQAQQEVLATFTAIGATIVENSGTGAENMDELISFHAYGPKFTEFNYDSEGNGYFFDSEGNEANERAFIGGNKINHFAAKTNTLNIAVYNGNVANLTFISDLEVDGIGTFNNLITLLFVKTKGEWKMVHEHHSPENLPLP
jgi:hypothetical protein